MKNIKTIISVCIIVFLIACNAEGKDWEYANYEYVLVDASENKWKLTTYYMGVGLDKGLSDLENPDALKTNFRNDLNAWAGEKSSSLGRDIKVLSSDVRVSCGDSDCDEVFEGTVKNYAKKESEGVLVFGDVFSNQRSIESKDTFKIGVEQNSLNSNKEVKFESGYPEPQFSSSYSMTWNGAKTFNAGEPKVRITFKDESKKSGTNICNSCCDCNEKIRNANKGDIIKLERDIEGSYGCIEIKNSGITFDCQNHKITNNNKDNYLVSVGVNVDGDNNKITNCKIEGFDKGISIYRSNNIIERNTIIESRDCGIEIIGAEGNTLTGNTISDSCLRLKDLNNKYIFCNDICMDTTSKGKNELSRNTCNSEKEALKELTIDISEDTLDEGKNKLMITIKNPANIYFEGDIKVEAHDEESSGSYRVWGEVIEIEGDKADKADFKLGSKSSSNIDLTISIEGGGREYENFLFDRVHTLKVTLNTSCGSEKVYVIPINVEKNKDEGNCISVELSSSPNDVKKLEDDSNYYELTANIRNTCSNRDIVLDNAYLRVSEGWSATTTEFKRGIYGDLRDLVLTGDVLLFPLNPEQYVIERGISWSGEAKYGKEAQNEWLYAAFKTRDNKWAQVPLTINPKNSITIKYKVYPEDGEDFQKGKIKNILLVDYYKAQHKMPYTSSLTPIGEYARAAETALTMNDNVWADVQYKGVPRTMKSVEAKDDIEIKTETGFFEGIGDWFRNLF